MTEDEAGTRSAIDSLVASGRFEEHSVTEGMSEPGLLVANPEKASRLSREFKDCALYTFYELTRLKPDWTIPLRRFPVITVQSPWVRDVFLAESIDPIVIPNGVDADFWSVSKKARNGFVCVARPYPRKDIDLLLAAHRAAGPAQRMLELVLAVNLRGVPPQSNVIAHTGHVDRVKLLNILHGARTFVLPTRGEGFLLSGLEAMSTAMPCILPEQGAHRIYANDRNSWLIQGDYVQATSWGAKWFQCNERSLIEAMAASLQEEPWPSKSAHARATAEQHPWSDAARRLAELCEEEKP